MSSIFANLFGIKPNNEDKASKASKASKADIYRVTEEGASAEDIKLDIGNSKTLHRSVSLGLPSRRPPAPPHPLSRAPSRHSPSAPPQPLSRASSYSPSAPPKHLVEASSSRIPSLSRAPSSHIPSAPPKHLVESPSSHNGGKKKKVTPKSAAGKRKK